MKIVHLSTFYVEYWKNFYRQRPYLINQEYRLQYNALTYDCFGWSDFWSYACKPLGYEVEEIFANVKPLQLRWAKERGFKPTKDWLLDIAFRQIQLFQPDTIFIDDYLTFPRGWIDEARQTCSSVKLVIGWCGAPYSDIDVFHAYDIVLSCIPEFVSCFNQMGCRSHHMNHAFEPRILDRINTEKNPSIEFCFIGKIGGGSQSHLERQLILENLLKQYPIEVFSPVTNSSLKRKFKLFVQELLEDTIDIVKKNGMSCKVLEDVLTRFALGSQQKLSKQLKKQIRPGVFGLDMFQAVRNSKIVFNSHIGASRYSASNMRLFEVTGCGTCLLTDWKKNLSSLFEPDLEVIAYSSLEDCLEKVKWLIANPSSTQAIAKAGQQRTLREHTFVHRAQELNSIIKKYLK